MEGLAAPRLLKNRGPELGLSTGSHAEGQGRLRGRILAFFGGEFLPQRALGTALRTTSSPDLAWAHCAGKKPGAERGMPPCSRGISPSDSRGR